MTLLSGVHHVAIICSNYETSKKFYTEVLGFEVVRETYRENRESYKLDLCVSANLFIELFSFATAPPRPSYPEACGLRHLAFNCVDLDTTISILKEHGVPVEDIRLDMNTNRRFTFFSDPDGLPIETFSANNTPFLTYAPEPIKQLAEIMAGPFMIAPDSIVASG